MADDRGLLRFWIAEALKLIREGEMFEATAILHHAAQGDHELTPEQRAYLELSERHYALRERVGSLEGQMRSLADANRKLMRDYTERKEYAR